MSPDQKPASAGELEKPLVNGLEIDPELIPYLLAVKAPREAETDMPEAKPLRNKDGVKLSAEQDEVLAEQLAQPRPGVSPGPGTATNPQAATIYQSLLVRRAEHQIEPALERVAGVLGYLGDSQELFHSVYVTGTNGKTSTARVTEALLGVLGYRTGRSTSPHLSNARKRITIDREPIPIAAFIAAFEDIEAQLALWENVYPDSQLSFFEILTVMAYAAFADAPVHVAVVRVRMGGRWDATNVVDAGTAVIGPISLEHEQWLGEGLINIATEKSGIIKRGANVVVAHQSEGALAVIQAAARRQDATLRYEGRDFEVLGRVAAVGGQILAIRTPTATYQDIFLPLFGAFQAQDVVMALTAVEAQLGGQVLDGGSVAQASAEVSSPGRPEVLHSSSMIVADAGHNPGAIQALVQAVAEDLRWEYTVGIYSAMADKDIETVLGIIEPVLGKVVVTPMSGPRTASLETLQSIAEDMFGSDRVIVADTMAETIAKAGGIDDLQQTPPGTSGVLVSGSVILSGMARMALNRD